MNESRAIDRILHGGRQPCCGATNAACGRPPAVVRETATGCEACGHPTTCHAYMWATA